ncbi:DUF771 domain-containing protein [Xylocopilactobacillus apicola]|uniref:DUF771 domain-containing protein n=1 Tax=Xylocopilactobacillus apicola TaxID=2932184 RepID=A0AAU9DZ71_9LACO|nr:DUF771 domain-containing protein [Xylocopilactobacillus apicola]BDR59553.1 hypothetical protein XA3_19940 [Xylocopilactobacillus apicola]
MVQSIKLAELEIPIPKGFRIITDEEFNDLNQKADYGRWWSMKDVEERYHRKRNWILGVLYNPKFKPLLEHKAVMYGGKGGKSVYLFEPTKFSKFMREWFPEIDKEMSNGYLNVKKAN